MKSAARTARMRSRFTLLTTTLYEQWPALCYVGYACWMGWIFLSYRSFELTRMYPGAELSHICGMSIPSTIAAAATMLCFSLGQRHLSTLLEKQQFMLGAGILATAGMMAIGYGGVQGPFFALSAISIGVGTSIVCLKVGVLYSKLGLRSSMVNAAVSILLAVFFYYCGIGLPEPWRPLFIALLPLLGSVVMALHPPTEPETLDDEPSETQAGMKDIPLHRMLIANAVIALISGVTSGSLTQSLDLVQFTEEQTSVMAIIGVLAVVMALYVSSGNCVSRVASLYTTLMTLGVILLLLRAVLPIPALFVDVTKESIRVILLCLFAYSSFKFLVSPVKVYGLCQATFLAFHALGWFIGWSLSPYAAELQLAINAIGATLLLVTMSFVFTQTTIRSFSSNAESTETRGRITHLASEGLDTEPATTSEEPQEKPSSPNQPSTADNPTLFLESKGLSIRETEIALLLLKGYSARWVGDDLGISESTVRSHLHTIYTKLNVHSRKEFRALFGR